jgi:hypothetical protein
MAETEMGKEWLRSPKGQVRDLPPCANETTIATVV